MLHSTFLFVIHLIALSNLTAEEGPRLSSSVQPYIDKTELAGAVMLVANKEKVLASEAAGWADIEAKRAMQPDSIFWIASQSKPVTAAALMMLVDEGKVDLQAPVEKYLPEFRGQMVIEEKSADRVVLRRPKHPITVREVLSHTSGLRSNLRSKGRRWISSRWPFVFAAMR
jgi:CubicO group peptidase (beta-lactamase class C family)